MKARFLALSVSLFAAFGLAGCFTSDRPLFGDDQAVAPYARITFAEHNSPEDKTTVTRAGKAYVGKIDNGTMTLRFLPVGDDLYVAESTAEQQGKTQRLYAVVRLDAKKNRAMAYKAMAHDGDAGPGLVACGDNMDMVCIEDVAAYEALARAAIAAGAEPDTIYDVSFK